MNYCKKIKLLRIAKGLSRDYLADKLNLTSRQYANIENGKCKLDVERLLSISRILDIEYDLLIDDKRELVINLKNK